MIYYLARCNEARAGQSVQYDAIRQQKAGIYTGKYAVNREKIQQDIPTLV